MLEKPYSVDHASSSTIGDSVSLAVIWVTLVRQYRRILVITGWLLLVAVIFVFLSTPTFLSNASLYTSGIKPSATVSDNNLPTVSASDYLSYLANFESVSDLQTQVDIISSPALVQNAVLVSGLNTTLTGPGIFSPLYIVWKLFYGGSVAYYDPQRTSLIASYASFSDPSVRARKYHIFFQDAGRYTVRSSGEDVLSGVVNQPASGNGLSILLQSPNPSLTPASGAVFKLTVTSPDITAAGLLKKPLSVLLGGTAALPSEVINLQFRSTNPYQAQAFLNALMSVYIDKTESWNSSVATKIEDFITGQLADVEAKLATSNQKLAAYQQQTGLISPPDNATAAINQESAYESRRVELGIEITSLQQILASLNNPNVVLNPYLLSQTGGTPISLLSEKLAEDLATLRNLQTRYTQDSPQVMSQQAQIDQERRGIQSMLTNELTSDQANLVAVNSEIATYKAQLGAIPSQSLQIAGLTLSNNVLGDLYVLLMQKQQEAAISKSAAVSSTQILMPAQLPWQATSPRLWIFVALALVAGLFGGSIWILLKNALDGRLQTEPEIRDIIDVPVLATIPSVSGKPTGIGQIEFEQSIYTLRKNIRQAFADTPPKIILLTAPSASEQKSIVALNLARVLAGDGKKVALVDADFSAGGLRTLIDNHPASGVSNWLSRGEPVALQIPRGEKFALLPAGVVENPAAAPFNEERAVSMLNALGAEYDYVILNGPTPPRLADIWTLAARADLILSVVQAGITLRQAVAKLQAAIGRMQPAQGVVILGYPALASRNPLFRLVPAS